MLPKLRAQSSLFIYLSIRELTVYAIVGFDCSRVVMDKYHFPLAAQKLVTSLEMIWDALDSSSELNATALTYICIER